MKVEIRSFYVQKLGNKLEEFEDAFDYKLTPDNLLLAMSDGATEASFSREWAQILTHGFINEKVHCWKRNFRKREKNITDWLKVLQKTWHAGIDFKKLQWFAVDKVSKGAFASLLGLRLTLKTGYWQALAVGDTNLFVIRNDKMILSWPLTMHEEFGSTPVIVGSNPAQNELSLSAIKTAHGKIQAGDIFIIATDAISDLIVRSYKNSWQEIAGISSQTEFESFVSQMRSQKELKNDDTTLVIVKIEEV